MGRRARQQVRRRRAAAGVRAEPGPGENFAWQVHAAQESWTAQLDVKASILLAFEGGTIVVSVPTQGWLSAAATDGWPRYLGLAGIVTLVVAMVLTAVTIAPRLGSPRRHRIEYRDNLVYFGHLRLWSPPALGRRLDRLTLADHNQMLSRQLVVMSRLNWRKHRFLQVSIVALLLALGALSGQVFLAWQG
ncbi:Pycsar system effector family protein [Micromonospora sp. NBC_01796]|uniref:Pycsar system effector family protein n=1 Tax=Micromonospora sp. NBC_01796 TaxID=2975987 RepID=UPI002DDBB4D8|nr:Pycsar system effector family protein [Micromonospora sp. NBC_01796]WSA90011.1 DUF5706 domain-containing protein [Micromonospora sp. NBC_01796]